MKVRIKFSKEGTMKFIGHLDTMRYFQKAIRRSGIDIAYSAGFSPHQIMSFAMPLGVGLESQGEYFDVEMNSLVSTQDIKMRLEAEMAPGIHILNVIVLSEHAGNAMASVAAAKYLAAFRYGFPKSADKDFDLKQALTDFYEKDAIPIIKRTKKSTKELDLKPGIYELTLQGSDIIMTVDASSSGNIKPQLVLQALYEEHGLTLGEFDLEITRLETYTNLGTKEHPHFVPLDSSEI